MTYASSTQPDTHSNTCLQTTHLNYKQHESGSTNKTSTSPTYTFPQHHHAPKDSYHNMTPGHITELLYPWNPNARDPAWLATQQTDQRGMLITQQLLLHTILNNIKSPTRQPYNINTYPTSLDTSLALPNIAL